MFKKVVLFTGLVATVYVAQSFAAPSIKKLGSNVARVGANTTIVKSDNTISNPDSVKRLSSVRSTNISGGVPVVANKGASVISAGNSGDGARLSLGKHIHSTGVASGNIKSINTTPAVSSDEFVNLSDRVSQLATESTNSINDVSDGLTDLTDRVSQLETDSTNSSNSINDVSEELSDLTVRVSQLETDSPKHINAVKESEESEEGGKYVSDVTVVDGNKLSVTKTNVLYAPVREGESTVGTAEIWIVK